jgi:hypothetical protein
VFAFPRDAIVPVEPELKYARKGRVSLPLSVCRPPHIIVSAARNFAVYHEEFLVVPPRQIGITSPTNDEDFLKALSLYLSSDLAFYHQFLTSTEFGVKRDRATLNALRRLPLGIANLSRKDFKVWSQLHSRLKRTTPRSVKETIGRKNDEETQLFLLTEEVEDELSRLVAQLNDLVGDSLGLDESERALIHDLVHVRLALNDGKTGRPAVRPPKASEIRAYAERLKSELDDYINGQLPKRHQVSAIYDDLSGMIQVDLADEAVVPQKVFVARADAATASELERARQSLRVQRSQWVYFDRNLRIFEGSRTFIFKPMQRFHWTESQAMIDARHIIAETLDETGGTA